MFGKSKFSLPMGPPPPKNKPVKGNSKRKKPPPLPLPRIAKGKGSTNQKKPGKVPNHINKSKGQLKPPTAPPPPQKINRTDSNNSASESKLFLDPSIAQSFKDSLRNLREGKNEKEESTQSDDGLEVEHQSETRENVVFDRLFMSSRRGKAKQTGKAAPTQVQQRSRVAIPSPYPEDMLRNSNNTEYSVLGELEAGDATAKKSGLLINKKPSILESYRNDNVPSILESIRENDKPKEAETVPNKETRPESLTIFAKLANRRRDISLSQPSRVSAETSLSWDTAV